MRGGTTPFVSADRGPNKDFVEDVFDISKWSEDSLIMKVYGDDKNICVSYMIFLVASNNSQCLKNWYFRKQNDYLIIQDAGGKYHPKIAFIIGEFTWRINISCLSTFNKYGGYRASAEKDYINFHNFHNWELRRRITVYKITIFWKNAWFTLSSVFIELCLFKK